jgi:hypothetical protein
LFVCLFVCLLCGFLLDPNNSKKFVGTIMTVNRVDVVRGDWMIITCCCCYCYCCLCCCLIFSFWEGGKLSAAEFFVRYPATCRRHQSWGKSDEKLRNSSVWEDRRDSPQQQQQRVHDLSLSFISFFLDPFFFT